MNETWVLRRTRTNRRSSELSEEKQGTASSLARTPLSALRDPWPPSQYPDRVSHSHLAVCECDLFVTSTRGGPSGAEAFPYQPLVLHPCCCARVSSTRSTVCDFYDGEKRCDQGCLVESLTEDSLFCAVGIVRFSSFLPLPCSSARTLKLVVHRL